MQLDKLVFYTNPMSRGRIVRWMLEEVRAPYETVILDWPETKAPEYLKINPMGKVPAIMHGNIVVTECAAICTYLADVFPFMRLAPPIISKKRGEYYRWLYFAAGPLEAAITNRSLGFDVPPDKKGDTGYGSFDAVMDTIEQAVSKSQYVLGDEFSTVDVYLGSQLGWGLQFGTIPMRPAFEKYCNSLRERPAAIRAARIDDELRAKQLLG